MLFCPWNSQARVLEWVLLNNAMRMERKARGMRQRKTGKEEGGKKQNRTLVKGILIFIRFWCNTKYILLRGFPGGFVVKNPPANAGYADLIPGLGRSSGEGHGNPLQYSCLGNPMDRGAWWSYTVHGVVKESDTASWLNNN